MVSSLYIGLIKLNKENKEYTKYLLVSNDTGVLLVDHGLFVLSFDSFEELYKNTVYKDIKRIGNIEL